VNAAPAQKEDCRVLNRDKELRLTNMNPMATRPETDGSSQALFWLGMRDTLPFVVSCFPFALACGLMSAQAGLSPGEVAAMSGLVYSGTAQCLALGLLQAGVGGGAIVLCTLVVNLRYFLQGLSLSPFFAWLPLRRVLLLAFGLVDETYALSISRYLKRNDGRGHPAYFLGSTSTLYVNWLVGTMLGTILGSSVGDPLRWGLDFAMPAAFLTIVLPQLVDLKVWTVFLVAGAAALLVNQLMPGTMYLLAAALIGSLLGILLEAAGSPPSAEVRPCVSVDAQADGGRYGS